MSIRIFLAEKTFIASPMMIVHHAGRLHMRVHDNRSDKRKSVLPQISAQCVRDRRTSGNVLPRPICAPGIQRLAIGKSPDISVERAELVTDVDKSPGVVDRRRDFQPVADNAGISKQTPGIAIGIARDLFPIPLAERPAKIFATPENGDPAQSGLEPFQNEHFEKLFVVMHRNAPLVVMIGAVERIGPGPGTSFDIPGGRLIMSILITGRGFSQAVPRQWQGLREW